MNDLIEVNSAMKSEEDEAGFMDQEEIDAIIRTKRKIRDPKACYACHRRKVKCDRNLPCDSCVKRDHPQLCSYERPTKKRKIQLNTATGDEEERSTTGPNVTLPREYVRRLEAEVELLRSKETKDEVESVNGDREGVHAPSTQTGTMHLGSRSVLAYMIGNKRSTADDAMNLLGQNILPNLGLDNETTTYPFVDLWGSNSRTHDVSGLCSAIPEDSLCREFWLTYRDIPCTIYPVVADVRLFGQQMDFMLKARRESVTPVDPERPYGVSQPWLALFFAVMASGCQSTGRAPQERELTSQVYICCSYQALRMSNFMIKPSLETVQAMLIVGNALSYNMNPGVAYILLGMTLRSALAMGLHVRSSWFSEHESFLRLRVWWALAWQDSHFSVCYDRPSSSVLCPSDIPYTRLSSPGQRSYVESMMAIIKLTQEILLERSIHSRIIATVPMMEKYKNEVHRIWKDANPRLRDRSLCNVLQDHLERLALKLHCSYLISEICRPTLQEPRSPGVSPGTQKSPTPCTTSDSATTALRQECTKYLESVVDAYVELLGINKRAARSWVGIQRSIAAAFLLGYHADTRREPRIIRLLTELERGIRDSAIEDTILPNSSTTSTEPLLPTTDSTSQAKEPPTWVQNMTKALNVLGSINAALADGRPPPKGIRSTTIQPTEITGTNESDRWNDPPYNFDARFGNGWTYGGMEDSGAMRYVQPGLWGT
ncbi:hypothetical protein BT93_L4415 [Corymbia citriodora subsp. variegata]|uniref:Zn(2)-C6 fungal-type domain-containing protein n=1 Tax=Corymbia citriodora subsp. variegata TaxID=360336 RepID=A0A8T0CFW4_CORYI|nr:hypothetical protein BT93_L4415 [Corymbia citriodora subsp. variegata]